MLPLLHLFQRLLKRFQRSEARDSERGASAVEYGLLVAAIAAIIVVIVFAIGKFVKAGFQDTCDGLAQGTYSTTPATCP